MDDKILIVDDEPEVLDILEKVLDAEGYEVIKASRGADAVALFETNPTALAVTDLKMPGMDGLEVIKRIKSLNPETEIIVLTAFATLDNAIQALKENGAYDFLSKPLEDIDQLLLTVGRAMEKRGLTLKNKALLLELENANSELERQNEALRAALDEVKVLKGLIPICAHCKNVRDDKGYWQRVEIYIARHTDAFFSHGICPDCLKALYPDLYGEIMGESDKDE